MSTFAFTLSEKLAALDFTDQVLLINALRKSIDYCKEEHHRLQELMPGCTDTYWHDQAKAIYRLYRKLDGYLTYPEFGTSADVQNPAQ